jgi:pyrroline-5-carboxylate reductase
LWQKEVLSMPANNIGLIGAGRMATALARGFINAGIVRANNIRASDPLALAREALEREAPGVHVSDNNTTVVEGADAVILAVKPQQIGDVLAEIRDAISLETLVVSIAAGITLNRLAAGLAPQQRIVRVMPNTPCLIGRGVSCFSLGLHATRADAEKVASLFSAVGAAFEVPESQLDAVTGLSGSGPAFVYTMIDALAEGGIAAGLPPALAAELSTRTVVGAAEMVLQTGETPAVLRDRVTSPGGTTQAGLAVLEEQRFRAAVVEAVAAATNRSAELGRSPK